MRHRDTESTSYIYFDAQNGYKGPKFKVSSLFGDFKLTRKSDSGKYVYAGYGIGLIVYGVDNSSSRNVDIEKIIS